MAKAQSHFPLRGIVVSLLAVIPATAVFAAEPHSPAWTIPDLNKVAGAAIDTAAQRLITPNQHADFLFRLAEALRQAGDVTRAKEVALQAGALFAPPFDVLDNIGLEQSVQTLIQYGDEADASRLLRGTDVKSEQAAIIGGIGAGRVSAGNTVGAEQSLAMFAGMRTGSAVRTNFSERDKAVTRIAAAAAMADKPEFALSLAALLPQDVYRQEIVAGAAVALCESPGNNRAKQKAGRQVAAKAIAAFKYVDAQEVVPNLGAYDVRLDFAEYAAEALAVCDSPAAAISFLRDNFKAPQLDTTRLRVANYLRYHGALPLARAVAPVPDAGDKHNVLTEMDFLWEAGEHQAAREFAEAAQMRLGNAKEGNSFVYYDLKVGAYDAATATTLSLAPNFVACDLARIITEEATHHDSKRVKSTLPLFTKALSTVGEDTCAVFIVPMFLAVGAAGLGADARPSFSAYRLAVTEADRTQRDEESNPFQQISAQTARKQESEEQLSVYKRAEFAGIEAVLGDLAGALTKAEHAGPMTVVRNCEGSGAQNPVTCPDFSGFGTMGTRLSAPERFPPDNRPLVRGPRAIILGTIAASLAGAGDLDDAWKVEAQLENAPLEALREPRDKALDAIGDAQLALGDTHASFATTVRIANLADRAWKLLALARMPPHS